MTRTAARQPARQAARPASRQADLSTIHILQKEVGLSNDDAEALKIALTGKASSADMSFEQRSKVIGHLRRLKVAQAPTTPAYTAQRPKLARSDDDHQDLRWGKARALWAKLAMGGQVRTNTDAALMAYVKRQTRVDAWRFLNGHQINEVLEALKKWCRRANIELDPS
jgi:phage gp16-like protein